MDEIEDILDDPANESKYELVKETLIRQLSDSSSQKARKLLEREQLGDRTPSQLQETSLQNSMVGSLAISGTASTGGIA